VDGEQVTITDANSALGTFVNRQRITECQLFPNDVIQVGETELRFDVVSPVDEFKAYAGPNPLRAKRSLPNKAEPPGAAPGQPPGVAPAVPSAGSAGAPTQATPGPAQVAPTPGEEPRAMPAARDEASERLFPRDYARKPRRRLRRVFPSLPLFAVLAGIGCAAILFLTGRRPTGQEFIVQIYVFSGHTRPVNGVAFSPDGRNALSGADDATARLWNLGEGKDAGVLTGHQGPVQGVAFSPDNRFALTGSQDKTVRLWDIEGTQEPRVFTGHTAPVYAVAFAPDGRTILSGGGNMDVEGGKEVPRDCAVRHWDVETGKILRVLSGHTGPVRSVAFSPDGKYALSGGDDKIIRLWDLAKGALVREFRGHEDPVRSVAFSPDGKYVLSGGRDQRVILWDAADARPVREFRGHTNDVSGVAFSSDGRHILSGDSDGTLRWWDVHTGRALAQSPFPESAVRGIAISGNGRRAVSGGSDKDVHLWRLPE
jgi:WD40 repeat protein